MDILSPDEGSCNSSRMSNKSEKNMADFEGEDGLSEDELAHITSHSQFAGQQHMQQQLAHMASMYRKRMPKCKLTINEVHEFHANLQFRHILFHEKTHFLILAGSVFCAEVNSS